MRYFQLHIAYSIGNWLAVIGIGGVLTIIAAGICLVAYYPDKLYDVTSAWVDSKIFKKGNK